MSIIEIREQLNFFFIFDDITLIKNISQIQSDAINYKDQLMASVSHELRTPLNGIINMIEHAICHSPGQINADFLHPALNSSKLLDSIINDFLDYSMINAGKLHLLFTTFNLRSACMDCIQLLEPMANLKGLTMKLIISKNTPSEIFSEPNRLKQVLLTLLNNAVKYTNKGQVLLEAFTKERKIHFAIKDTGMGINPEEKNRIRMIISEENYLNKVNKNSTGAGLGLKISSKLIELLNRNEKSLQSSSLHCHSELGKGSQFCFSIMNQDSREPTLKSDKIDSHVFESMNFKVGIKMIKKGEEFLEPCSENFQKIDEIKEEKQNISSLNHLDLEFNKEMIDQRFQIDRIYEFPLKIRRENVILIVDDDVYNLEVLKFFIKSFNYKAETAINGKEAIEKIKDSHHIMNYLLVLMDFNMPVMNGIEATSYLIKEMKEKTMKTIPIIGITAYVSKEEADKGIKAGMLEILHKPIKKEELKGILNKYIGFYENTPP